MVTVSEAELPNAVTVTVSLPEWAAVRLNIACPELSVVTVAALRVFPALEVTVTV
jgi:hypothetical protein